MEKKEIIYGRNPVLEYLKQAEGPQGLELLVSKSAHGKIIDTITGEARRKGINPAYCDRNTLARYQPSAKHQGVVLLARVAEDKTGGREFIEGVARRKGVLVILDQLTDPHNVGAIIRTAEALGGDGVIISKSHSADITGSVAKASAGATAHLKVISVPNISNYIDILKKEGFWIAGTSGDGDGDLKRLRELRPLVIIIGSEGSGMRRLTAEKCDLTVRIPLKGRIASLNASVAAGILLYEILRD